MVVRVLKLYILPEALKTLWMELGAQNSMLDVFMLHVALYYPRIHTFCG